MSALRAVGATAAVYFGVVFGVAFVFGTIRVTWLLPALGERRAELIEAPFMAVLIVLAARWLVRRRPMSAARHACAGIAAASLVLGADLMVGVFARGMSVIEVFVDRDPVSGSVYYALIVLFALLPGWLAHRAATRAPG